MARQGFGELIGPRSVGHWLVVVATIVGREEEEEERRRKEKKKREKKKKLDSILENVPRNKEQLFSTF